MRRGSCRLGKSACGLGSLWSPAPRFTSQSNDAGLLLLTMANLVGPRRCDLHRIQVLRFFLPTDG